METTLPTVSVVIPTADWDHMLWRLNLALQGLCFQTVAPQEVVVVDSIGKTDKVLDLVSKFTDRLNIKGIKLPDSDIVFRTGGARNRGVANLSQPCDRILFLDADCVPFPKVVEAHQKIHRLDLVGLGFRAHIKAHKGMTLNDVYSAPVKSPDNRISENKIFKDARCCHSHHLSFCYKMFYKIKGFWPCTVICEDLEIGTRVMRVKGVFEYIETPKVRHLDHPIWRPYPNKGLPSWHVMPRQSQDLPGYTREIPDFLKWGEL